uniref:RETREG1-3/ARL6IP-like N-terminal reticulon-homology domain-containing protein n=1 Tax=Macaca fascicularis TaxID=9541 RepID=A0A7N9D1A7_MACFA
MAEGDNRSTNLLVSPGLLSPGSRARPPDVRGFKHRGLVPVTRRGPGPSLPGQATMPGPRASWAAETASLEEQLQGWGEVMLMADKVLRWERAWFPPAIMGVVSLVFLIIYYLDPSVLSGVSCFVMFLCLADYLVPILAPRIFGSNKWTTEQQQRFHEICSNLVKTRRRAVGWWKRLFTLKEEKPKMYFMTMIVSLAAVAWVGQQVHNLLLTYLIVTSLLLLPGLNQHGIISKYIGMAKREINKLLKQKEKKNE